MLKLYLLVVFILSAIIACVTVPETNRKAFRLVGDQQLNEIGVSTYKEMLQKEKLSTNKQLVAQVREIGNRIALVSGEKFDWEFNVIESDTVNAFCLPGGKVAVYTGILKPAQNTAALAAIMGHEVAHAVARHSAERMSQAMLTQTSLAVVGSIFSDPEKNSGILAALGLGAQFGIMLPFSRKHETEADQMGMVYMAKAGYDPSEAAKFWERMNALEGGGKRPPELLSTHPSPDSRIKNLNQLANSPKIQSYYQTSNKQNSIKIF